MNTQQPEALMFAKQSGIKDSVIGFYKDELGLFFRLAYARGMLKQAEQSRHWSDCAVNSEPAYPAGECDCGGYNGSGTVTIIRQWVGIDDEEIRQADHRMVEGSYHHSFKQGVKWAEAKLKEKNT